MGQQQLHSDEQKVNLLELPREILEKFFIYMDEDMLINGKYLLIASHVCKLFASVAERVFAREYFDERYDIKGWGEEKETLFYRTMLNRYGEKIREIHVSCDD